MKSAFKEISTGLTNHQTEHCWEERKRDSELEDGFEENKIQGRILFWSYGERGLETWSLEWEDLAKHCKKRIETVGRDNFQELMAGSSRHGSVVNKSD